MKVDIYIETSSTIRESQIESALMSFQYRYETKNEPRKALDILKELGIRQSWLHLQKLLNA